MQTKPYRERATINRRGVLAATGAFFALRALPAQAQGTNPESTVLAYAGSYTTSDAGVGAGIYGYRVNTRTGVLTRIGLTENIANPSWLALHPSKRVLYAVSEIKAGIVSAYTIDAASGALTKVNDVSSQGAFPTHMSVHPSGRYAFVANYVSGNVGVFPIHPDGSLGDATDIVAGYGPAQPARAADNAPGNFAVSDHHASHMHMIAPDPAGRFVLANDAGKDRTYIWKMDLANGKLVPAAAPFVEALPGSAPRHFAFHPNGRFLYNLTEQDCMVSVYAYAPQTGHLTLLQNLSTLPTGFAGSNLGSEIAVSPDGAFVYAANRLHDTIAVFAVSADGRLTARGEVPVQADYPRSFSIDPTGRFLYACNQKGDAITTFARDPQTGALTFTGSYEPAGTPVSLTFVV